MDADLVLAPHAALACHTAARLMHSPPALPVLHQTQAWLAGPMLPQLYPCLRRAARLTCGLLPTHPAVSHMTPSWWTSTVCHCWCMGACDEHLWTGTCSASVKVTSCRVPRRGCDQRSLYSGVRPIVHCHGRTTLGWASPWSPAHDLMCPLPVHTQARRVRPGG